MVFESIKVSVNPNIYPLDVIYSAAYVFLDRCYLLLEGDAEKEVIVDLSLKGEGDLEIIKKEFLNELLNIAFYKKQSEKNQKIREAIVQKALLTNMGVSENEMPQEQNVAFDDNFVENLENIDDSDSSEDLAAIATPWEEKFGSEEETKEAPVEAPAETKCKEEVVKKEEPLEIEDLEDVALPWEGDK